MVNYGPAQGASAKQGGAGASTIDSRLSPIGSDVDGASRAPPFSPAPRTESSKGPLPGEISRGKSSWIFRDAKATTEGGDDEDSLKSEKARPVKT